MTARLQGCSNRDLDVGKSQVADRRLLAVNGQAWWVSAVIVMCSKDIAKEPEPEFPPQLNSTRWVEVTEQMLHLTGRRLPALHAMVPQVLDVADDGRFP
jgi:hypothetical protein